MEIIRVVLADDHPAILSGLHRHLDNSVGIEVVATCQSGLDAIHAAKKHLPDVLILDNYLRDLEAPEVIRRLVNEQMTTRFLVLSGHFKKETIEEILRAGASGYVAKDEAMEWLLPAIQGIMKGEICLSPMVQAEVDGNYRA